MTLHEALVLADAALERGETPAIPHEGSPVAVGLVVATPNSMQGAWLRRLARSRSSAPDAWPWRDAFNA